jgi:hypothetical protein
LPKINIEKWSKVYERDYFSDCGEGERFPIFVANGKKQRDSSPYFTKSSRVYRKRGYLTKPEFVSIGIWKSIRQVNNYYANSKEIIKDTTQRAISADNLDEALESLLELKGVRIPVASAILTMVFPARYCVIDFRAWRALQWYNGSFKTMRYIKYSELLNDFMRYHDDIKVYEGYLMSIQRIARTKKCTPRKVEMALWKFDEYEGVLQNELQTHTR